MSRRLGPPYAVVWGLLFLGGTPALGQAPQVRYLYPAQVTAGTTIEAEFIGTQVDRIERIYCARPGLEARPAGKGKAAFTAAPGALPGDGDVWAVSASGASVPARLEVGGCPVRTEAEPNNTPNQAQEVELPIAVCGRIDPGTDSDWYRVRLKAGDGLTLACRSAELGGTLLPTLVVLDPQGREIAHDTLTQAEPTVHVPIAEEGVYSIGVQDRSYRSTPAPFYRLALTTGPWITAAYPPTLTKGKTSRVTLYGYRLPAGEPAAGSDSGLQRRTIEVNAAAREADGGRIPTRSLFVESFEYRPAEGGGSVRFELLDRPTADAAEETADGASADVALRTIPFDVVNRFSSSRQAVHWYRFRAEAGRTYRLEAVAERIDRACDLELIVYDSTGKVLETLGNTITPKEIGSDVPLESRDPAGSWKAPADGEYRLAVRDLSALPIPSVERAYRLSVGPRLEDVRVVSLLGTDASRGWSVPAGGKLAITLVAVRGGGHEGPIEVRAENLPAGLKVAPVTIAARKSTGVLTLEADKNAKPWVGPIRLIATTEANRAAMIVEVRAVSRPGPAEPAGPRIYDQVVVAVGGSVGK